MKHIKIFESFLTEVYGPNGYFPPMGADPYKEKNEHTEQIFVGNTAVDIATELKKKLDEVNPELAKAHFMAAPFVNYYPSTKEGNLILGFCFTKLPTYNHDRDWKLESSLYDKYKGELESILAKSKTAIWSDFHKGMSGRYKGVSWKSGIAFSIVTPQKQLSDAMADKLQAIFEK